MPKDPSPISGPSDSQFGGMAVRLGHCTEHQVRECLAVQAAMKQMGVLEPIGEILIKKGYLTPPQQKQILKALGVHVSPIPGYEIMAKLGQGGMGTVYKAKQVAMNRIVALKILSTLGTQDPTFIQRFFREAQAAARLNHPNIITAYDTGEAGGVHYFAMEYVDGKSTRQLVDITGPFDERRALEIVRQIAMALQYIHENGMIHRDIKPENIVVPRQGPVKLCDFGLAKFTQNSDQSLTQTGWSAGTPLYMSPEIIRGVKDIDIRSDLYSLGATLYYLVTGTFVFLGETTAMTLHQHMTEPPPDPRQKNPALSEELARIYFMLMSKDRTGRYAAPKDLVEDTDALLADKSLIHAPPLPSPARLPRTCRQISAPRSIWRRVLVPVGVVVLVAGVSAAAFLMPRSQSKEVRIEPPQNPLPPPPTIPAKDVEESPHAFQLLAQAERHAQEEEWEEFLEIVEKLEPYASLPEVQECHEKLETWRYEAAQTLKKRTATQRIHEEAGLAEREASTRVNVEEAKAAWVKARDLYGAVSAEEGVQRCNGEIAAIDLWLELEAALGRKSWERARELLKHIQDRTSTTHYYTLRSPSLKGEADAVEQEIVAGGLLRRVQKAEAEENWGELADGLVRLDEMGPRSVTYADHRQEIQRWRQRLEEERKGWTERRATESWSGAEEALSRRQWEEARRLLLEFRRDFVATEFYKSHEEDVDAGLARCETERQKAREVTADELWKRIKDDHKGARLEEVLQGLTLLATEYSDTTTFRSNRSAIDRLRRQVDRELGETVVEFDFEESVESWWSETENPGAVTIVQVDEARDGKKGAKISFPPATGNWCRIVHGLNLLDSRADMVTFWARAPVKKGIRVPLRIFFQEGSDDHGIEIIAKDFTITNEWQKYAFRITEVNQLVFSQEGNRRLDREKVTALGFEKPDAGRQAEESPPAEVFIDSLRIRRPK